MPVHFWFFRVWVVYTFSLPVSLPVVLYFLHHVCLIQVTIALRFHLFPFRTEKLSSVTPMVLRNSGRVGSRRFLERSPCIGRCRGFLVFGLSFRTEKLSSFVCLALFCLLCFACFLGVNRFLVGIIFMLVKYLSLLLGCCFPLQSTKDCCGKSPCLRVKILAIRRTPLTKTASKKLHKAWPDGGTFMQKRREML